VRSGCVILVVASFFLGACGGLGQRYREASKRIPPGSGIQEQLLEGRPTLAVVERIGDGAPGLCFAARTLEPPIANYGLSLVLQRRLQRAGIATEGYPNGIGFSLAILVNSPTQAAASIDALRDALALEIRPIDLDRQFLDTITGQFGPGNVDPPGDIAIAHCSGQLYRDARQSAALADGAVLVRWLEAARKRASSRNHTSFAVVGSPQVTTVVRSRLLALADWPHREDLPIADDTWRSEPEVQVSTSPDWSFSLAWATGSIASSVSAWRVLRAPDSAFMAQLSSLESAWRVDSISAVAGPLGGCLRIDMSDAERSSPKSPTEVGRIVRLALNESRTALLHSSRQDSADLTEIIGSDARLTSRRVAWRALSKEQPDSQHHYRLSLRGPGNSRELGKSVLQTLSQNTPAVEVRYKAEPGQPEQWLLLASPCGISAEMDQDSGAAAAWLRALARKYSSNSGTVLEPWITEDAVGLLAHTKLSSSTNTAEWGSWQLGDALGRVLATSKVTGQDLAFTREELLVRVGVQPRRAWGQLIDVVSAHKPSLFEPLGMAESIRHLNLTDLLQSRRRWMREPLRAALLTNEPNPTPAAIASSMARWLEPHRTGEHTCLPTPNGYPLAQETQIVTYSTDELDASVYLAYALQGAGGAPQSYDSWLEWLLNRPRGWLDRSVIEPGFARVASAQLRGPRGRRILFVVLDSADDALAMEATKRIRLLLSEVGRTGASAVETDLAYRWSIERSIKSALDPRNRLVRLWLGESETSQPSRAGFSPYLAKALGAPQVTIMRVRK
jgi:hypothetical protein